MTIPETVNKPKEVKEEYINHLVRIGINRVSIGIQSFDANTLSSLERNHGAADSLNAIKVVSKMKTIDTTIDLIYGVMGQDIESLRKDIEIFCSHDVDHLSMYQLTIEPNTIFYNTMADCQANIGNDAMNTK